MLGWLLLSIVCHVILLKPIYMHVYVAYHAFLLYVFLICKEHLFMTVYLLRLFHGLMMIFLGIVGDGSIVGGQEAAKVEKTS